MNGFVVALGSDAAGNIAELVDAPHLQASHFETHRFDHDLQIVLWGETRGDVSLRASGDWVVLFNGYVAESELLDGPPADAVCDALKASSDPVKTLEAIAKSIYGSFAILAIRPSTRDVFTVSDRVASRPAWVKNTDGGILASSHSIAIAQISGAEPDPLGLGSLLLFGGLVDPTRCIYAGIETSREGEVRQLRPGENPRTTIYHRFEHKPEKHSYRDWLERVSASLSNSAQRLLTTCKKPLVYLSGGVDSRLAASTLRAAGADPLFVTLADAHNMETRVASKVAKALGCEHKIVLRDRHWYLRAIPRATFDSNGVFLFHQAHFAPSFLDAQREHSVDAAILGDLCEAFSKTLSSPENQNGLWSSDQFVAFIQTQTLLPPYKTVDRSATLSLLNPDMRERVERAVFEAISTRYEEIAKTSDDPKIVVDQFVRWQSLQSIGTYGMFVDVRSGGPERNLMFDKDIQQILETMPSTFRDGNNLGKRLIQKMHKGAGRVVDANSYLPLSFPPAAHSFAKFMRPIAGKLRRRFVENSHLTTASWPHLPMLYGGDKEWKTEVGRLLETPELLPADVFDRKAIENCWKEICGGELRRTADLEKLIHMAKLREIETKVHA